MELSKRDLVILITAARYSRLSLERDTASSRKVRKLNNKSIIELSEVIEKLEDELYEGGK